MQTETALMSVMQTDSQPNPTLQNLQAQPTNTTEVTPLQNVTVEDNPQPTGETPTQETQTLYPQRQNGKRPRAVLL